MKILKVKFSGGSLGKNLGCEKSPDLILEGIKSEEVKVSNGNIDETMENISSTDGDILVGGDHSISYGSFKGFSKKFKNPGIIIFDAHPDIYPEELTLFGKALTEKQIITHENWVYCLIKEGILKKENLIFVGVRAIDEKEKEYLDKNRIKYFTVDRVFKNEEDVCDVIMENAINFDGLYLSIDIDVLDPAFAPGTGYREVNGLTSQQLFYFLKRIKLMKNLRRIDLVEINPDKDVNDMTVNIGMKIIKEFI